MEGAAAPRRPRRARPRGAPPAAVGRGREGAGEEGGHHPRQARPSPDRRRRGGGAGAETVGWTLLQIGTGYLSRGLENNNTTVISN